MPTARYVPLPGSGCESHPSDVTASTTTAPVTVQANGEPYRAESQGGGSACLVVFSTVAPVRGVTSDFRDCVIRLWGITGEASALLCEQWLPESIDDLGGSIVAAQYEGAYWAGFRAEVRKVPPRVGLPNPSPPFTLGLVATGGAPIAAIQPAGFTRWFTSQVIVAGGAPVEILQPDPMRRRALIKDLTNGGSTMFIGPDDTVSTATGYPVPTPTEGAGLEIRHTEAVWTVHAGEGSQTIAVLVERQ